MSVAGGAGGFGCAGWSVVGGLGASGFGCCFAPHPDANTNSPADNSVAAMALIMIQSSFLDWRSRPRTRPSWGAALLTAATSRVFRKISHRLVCSGGPSFGGRLAPGPQLAAHDPVAGGAGEVLGQPGWSAGVGPRQPFILCRLSRFRRLLLSPSVRFSACNPARMIRAARLQTYDCRSPGAAAVSSSAPRPARRPRPPPTRPAARRCGAPASRRRGAG